MSKFGVNVPPGIPVFSLDEVNNAAQQMKSPDGQASTPWSFEDEQHFLYF